MKSLFALIVMVAVAGCQVEPDELLLDSLPPSTPITREYPTINLPPGLRQQNWVGDRGEGSCVHATTVMLYRWNGFPAMADWWKANNANGEWAEDLNQRFDNANVRYSYTTEYDPAFLQWACDTRRGCGITVMGGRHCVLLVHLDETWAAIIDNNQPDVIQWMPRETLLAEWNNSHHWAFTVHYFPAPPLPQ